MMFKTKERIPECGAIEDGNQISMEQYSELMKKRLGMVYHKFVNYIINEVKPPQNSKALEIGPGPGWVGIYLLKERNDIYLDAIEPSSDMIRVANINAKDQGVEEKVNYKQGFAENMDDAPNDYYDLIFSSYSIHHWENPERVFQEISRVLKPQGKLYIEDFRRDVVFPINLLLSIMIYVIQNIFHGTSIKYWKSSIDASYTPDEIQQMINKLQRSDWTVRKRVMELVIEKT